MWILQMSLPIPTPPRNLSSSRVLSGTNPIPTNLFLTTNLSVPSLLPARTPWITVTPVRMGGGPRTFPGGVSKWQWKRMQAKKAKQLLKARLARERQIYEMRKRAELKAAVSELERPWEVVEKAPKLFSVSADEQVKVLADRFQRPGGFDMWSEKDGPELFSHVDGVASARFFPKGVVHSIKPYGKIDDGSDGTGELDLPTSVSKPETPEQRNGHLYSGRFGGVSRGEGRFETKNFVKSSVERNSKDSNAKFRKKGKRRSSRIENWNNLNGEQRRETPAAYSGGNGRRGSGLQKLVDLNSEVHDLSLQHDGSYGFQAENLGCDSSSGARIGNAVKNEPF
ncbi:uncharacterized protein LOC127787894 [Diospyros lotus]|uniref:uncharacterized protein LOC127787894 n=1 Tax=Diospyros lotus TaxID=55363 RepID=UPI002258D47C|nr:uncharacterized protein LOC127787894 [Diospyros lotus]